MKLPIGVLMVAAAYAQDASVSGVVRDVSTKLPIAGAAVELRPQGNKDARSAITGSDGSYRFEGVPPGADYLIVWKADGYIGLRAPIQPARSIKVAAGAEARQILELSPIDSIEGAVIDEDGKPVAGVQVLVNSNRRTTTAKDGSYLLAAMNPGAYRLGFRIPEEYRLETLHRKEDTGEVFGYPVVEEASTPIVLAGPMQLHGADMRLRRVRLVHVAGHFTEKANGAAVSSLRVGLEPVSRGGAYETLEPRSLDGDGEFRFDNIPEGGYLLTVYRREEDDEALPFVVPVEAGRAGIDDLKIVLPPFRTINVMARTDDNLKWSGTMRVTVHSTLLGTAFRAASLQSETASLGVIPPGNWWVQVNGDGHASDGRGLAADRITFGGQEVVGRQITVAETGDMKLEIHLTPHTGTIAASVPIEDGKEGIGGIFVAVPEGDPLTGSFPKLIATMGGLDLMKQDGTGKIAGLLPGTYQVNATSNEGERFAAKAEVRDGETVRVKLSPVKQ